MRQGLLSQVQVQVQEKFKIKVQVHAHDHEAGQVLLRTNICTITITNTCT